MKDDQALAKLLGELGASRLANNLNQLAKAANTGSLPITLETENVIYAARDVERIRKQLIAALGLGGGGSPSRPEIAGKVRPQPFGGGTVPRFPPKGLGLYGWAEGAGLIHLCQGSSPGASNPEGRDSERGSGRSLEPVAGSRK